MISSFSDSGYLFSGSRPASQYKDSPSSGIRNTGDFCVLPLLSLSSLFYCLTFLAVLCYRLLFPDVWEPPVLPGPVSHSFSSRLGDLQLQLCQTSAPPHQPGSPQHQRSQTPAVRGGAGTLSYVPVSVLVAFPRKVALVRLQWALFTRRVTLPKPEW